MKMSTIFIFITYQLIQIIILPLFPIYLIIRKIKKKPVFGNFKERIGLIPKNKSKKKTIWIHAVSVGEILSIQNLIDQIKKKVPNSICYITTGTITGKKIAKKNLNYDYLTFLPYDFLLPIFVAFNRIKPNRLIIVEAETWPNLIYLAIYLKVPIYMINARISKQSEKKYELLRFLYRSLLKKFSLILTQSKYDTQKFKSLGIKTEIITAGNIKTLNVLTKKNKIEKLLIKNKYPTLLLGSIHPGEIDIYINLYKKLKSKIIDLKIIIAPRHFHWKNELIKKIKETNYSFYLWEKNNLQINSINNKFKEIDILLVCKLGELFKLYQLADIFYLGGTFIPIGGHNLLEPAVWTKPSVIGPYYSNCSDIAKKLESINGIIKVNNEIELYNKSNELLKNPKSKKRVGINSYNWLKKEAFNINEKINQLIEQLNK